MASVCEVCDKRPSFGRNIRHKHSGRWRRKAPRTSRMFKPNVQRLRFIENGKMVRKNVCTSCLRTVLKQMSK